MTGGMLGNWLGGRRTFEVPCTVEVEHTPESLHAYVDLDGDVDIQPGDEVIVHGEPIRAGFGEKIIERRQATVIRANWLGRLATRFHSGFELTELYEVSFTPRRKL